MKVKELKAALKELGLSTKGKKLELENRYVEAMMEEEPVVEEAPVELPEEEEIEEQVIEEVVEEELAEEIAEEEEEEAPVEEEVVEEEDEVIDLGRGAFLVNGAYTVPKRPSTPSLRWNKEVYGKKPNGGFVNKFTGVHCDGDGKEMVPLEAQEE